MFEDFTSTEKFALVCAVINVTHADVKLDDREVEYVSSLMEEMGLEDFQELLTRYERDITTHDAYIGALKNVFADSARRSILNECVGAMDVDDEHHEDEIAAIKEICETWNMDPDEFVK